MHVMLQFSLLLPCLMYFSLSENMTVLLLACHLRLFFNKKMKPLRT